MRPRGKRHFVVKVSIVVSGCISSVWGQKCVSKRMKPHALASQLQTVERL